MPTTKPKNKKPIAVKSGGKVSVKRGKSQKQETVFTLDELKQLLTECHKGNCYLKIGISAEDLGLTISEELRDDEGTSLYIIYEDKDGRKIADCSLALGHTYSRHAAGKDYTGKKDRSQGEKSMRWAGLIMSCLSSLHEYDGKLVVPKVLQEIIGKRALEMMLEDVLATFGKEPYVATEAAKKAGGAYTSAFNTLLQAASQKPKPGGQAKDGQTRKKECWAFDCVTGFVQKHRRLPNQRWLHSQLEVLGVKFDDEGGRGPAKYRSMLGRAGFSSLPE